MQVGVVTDAWDINSSSSVTSSISTSKSSGSVSMQSDDLVVASHDRAENGPHLNFSLKHQITGSHSLGRFNSGPTTIPVKKAIEVRQTNTAVRRMVESQADTSSGSCHQGATAIPVQVTGCAAVPYNGSPFVPPWPE
jgi:hypothetical protein